MLPGSGGEISNIVYDNIEIHMPLWWGIYIGPQQQKEPDGSGDGCMTYPIGGCTTQPLITVSNITLNNIRQYGSLLPPGIIRCNETNPCKGFVFNNVKASGWWKFLKLGYITEHIEGVVTHSDPAPAFNSEYTLTTNGLIRDFADEFVAEFKDMLHEVWVWMHPDMRDEDDEERGHHRRDRHGRHPRRDGPCHRALEMIQQFYAAFY